MLYPVSNVPYQPVYTLPSPVARLTRLPAVAPRRRLRGQGYEFAHIEPGALSDLATVLPCPGCGREARDGDLAFCFPRGIPRPPECWHYDPCWLARFEQEQPS